jgi:ATP-binding protein involved in chromosome partitioning
MLNKETIQKALEQVKLPAIGKNLVQMNFVKKIEIDNSKVQVTLELRAPHTSKKDFIYSESLQVLTQTPGVESVKVIITEKAAAKAQEQPAMDIKNLGKVKSIIGIASGKGGVGKSTVTANLAMSLAMDGFKVGVLDADIYGPSMNLMFKINEAPVVNEDKTVYPVVVEKGIKVISMAMFSEADKAVIWRGPMAAQMIQNFVSRVHWGRLDYLLIDMPPGTGDIQLTLTQNCPMNGAVIVTTPQDVSVIDAKKGLQMFETVSVPVLGVIENMSYFICDNCTTKHHIFRSGGGERISRSLGAPFLGDLPLDPTVAETADKGRPAMLSQQGSLYHKAFSDVSANLIDQINILNNSNSDAMLQFDLKWDEIPEVSQ